MKNIQHTIILCMLFATPLSCPAVGLNDMFGVWGSVSLKGNFNVISPELEQFKWSVTNQTRTRDDAGNDTRFTENILFSQVGYQINEHASIWLGYVHDWLEPLNLRPFQESRPYQDFVWIQTVNDFKLKFRTRMDERINQRSGSVGYRPRQLVQISHPLPIIEHLTTYTGYEALFYLNNSEFGRQGIAENRVYTGLNYQFTGQLGFSIGYMGQHVIRRRSGNDIFTHNIQTNIHYRF